MTEHAAKPRDPIARALDVTIQVICGLICAAGLGLLVLLGMDLHGACELWRTRYTTCEQAGCKDRLASERPLACSAPR